MVLSVCWLGHKHFIVQTTAEGLYRFEGPAFPTVQVSGRPLFLTNAIIENRAVLESSSCTKV